MIEPCVTLPDAQNFRIVGARVPAVLAPELPAASPADLVPCALTVVDGRIAKLESATAKATSPRRGEGWGEGDAPFPEEGGQDGLPEVDARDGIVLPRFVDMHTHIDKGHIAGRSPNRDGSFLGAREAVMADRQARWSAEDVRRRMEFSLRCAHAHGTAALRTHIDSIGPQTAISWPVFAEMRESWRGRVVLQAAALFPYEFAVDDEPQFRAIVETVARHGGVIGGLTHKGDPPDAKLELALDRLFGAATAHGLDLDFHVDESASPDARSLERIAEAALRHRFKGKIVAGHCCSLALASDEERARVIERVGEAGIAVVSLPMCNMYLQDRQPGRTPRWRGVAPLHELDAAGVTTVVASDNTRDPFYAYGDLDMIEVFREATRILHLDHSERPWARLLSATAADVMGLPEHGRIREGGPADLVLTGARTLAELVTRPQADRVVMVGGRALGARLPDFRELD